MNGVKVNAITSLPVTSVNCKKKMMKKEIDEENDILYTYLMTINIPIIKNIFIILNSFFSTLKCLAKDKDAVLICDTLNVSVSAGALLATKIFKRKSIGIVTDIPILLSRNKNSISVRLNNFIINHFGSYVLLTEQMNKLINKREVPFALVEGQVDSGMRSVKNEICNKYSKKVCIYAGGIHKIYGIDYLIKAFIQANLPKAELHIYGDGDFEIELKEICMRYKQIKYFGVVSNDIIVQEELKASLLINPRPTNEEYTKYSFPSKNMEYMASGTPILTTKLPGMPEEYKEFVYLINDETIEGLKSALKQVLSKSSEELHHKGLRAKEFVLKNKNNVIQAKKIIDMISKNNSD